MYPIGKECRIRSIQVHGQDVDRCYAGQRVAINLSNVKKKEIARGCVLAPPNSMKNTMLLDVKLNMLPSSMRVLTNHARLHFFTGTSEVLCRAVLLDKEDLSGREWICAASSGRRGGIAKRRQICCPFLFSDGDNRGRCCSGAKSRAKEAFPAGCDRGTEAERIRFLRGYYRTSCQGACRDDGNTWGTCEIDCTSMEEVEADVRSLEAQGKVYVFQMKKDVYVWHAASENAMRETLCETLRSYHNSHPYRYGMKKAEVHMTYLKKVKANVFDLYMELLVEKGVLRRHQEFLALPEFEIPKDERYQRLHDQMITVFEDVKI